MSSNRYYISREDQDSGHISYLIFDTGGTQVAMTTESTDPHAKKMAELICRSLNWEEGEIGMLRDEVTRLKKDLEDSIADYKGALEHHALLVKNIYQRDEEITRLKKIVDAAWAFMDNYVELTGEDRPEGPEWAALREMLFGWLVSPVKKSTGEDHAVLDLSDMTIRPTDNPQAVSRDELEKALKMEGLGNDEPHNAL